MSNKEQNDEFEMFGPDDVYVPEEADDVYADIDGVDTDEVDDVFSEKYEEEYSKKRDEQKKNKANDKKRLIKIIIGVIIALVIVCAFYFCDSGIIGAYKKNFKQNFNTLFSSEQAVDIGVTEKNSNVQYYVDDKSSATDDEERVLIRNANNIKTIPFESASKGKFIAYRNGLICARTNYICFIDKSGDIVWEKDTTVVDPLLSGEGNYIALASENGTKLCLYNGEELIFECDIENNIKNMRVSANGDTVLVCDKDGYKGSIYVYNKEGKKVFSWFSGKNYVISADISSSSRRVAASLLNMDSKANSVIKVFDINSRENNIETIFNDTIIFKVEYSSDMITGFGDNSLVSMASSGRVVSDKRFDKVDINHFGCDYEGNKLINIDSASIPVLQLYNRKGLLRKEMILDNAPDFIDVLGDTVLYNDGRDIFLRKMGSNRMERYTATMDILNTVVISEGRYAVIHSNSLELIG